MRHQDMTERDGGMKKRESYALATCWVNGSLVRMLVRETSTTGTHLVIVDMF